MGRRRVGGGLVLVSLSLAVGLVGLALAGPASARALPAAEVAEYRDATGLGRAGAEAQLALQDRAAGIVGLLEGVLGTDYAGVWFDDASGEFVVPVVRDADVGEVERALTGLGLAGGYRTTEVEHSWGELETAQTKVEGLVGEEALFTYPDPRSNGVVVELAADATAAEASAVRAAGDRAAAEVEVRRSPDGARSVDLLACFQAAAVCSKPLRAGVGMREGWEASQGPNCTLAFKAIGNTFGNRFMLTAGHCVSYPGFKTVRAMEYPSLDIDQIGWTEQKNFPPGDWAKIKANGSEWDTPNWPSLLAYWTVDQEWPITAETASYVGQQVCFAGISTILDCGIVDSLDASAQNGQQHLTIYKNGCANPGDSGAPIFAGHVALGILTGRVEPTPPCGQMRVVYTEVTEAADEMGVTVGPRLGTAPFAGTREESQLSSYSVRLNGEVAPHGIQSNYHFQYGTTTAYGQSTPLANAGSQWGKTPVSADVTGSLQPNTTYHYRLVAQNASGVGVGEDGEFKTPLALPAFEANLPTTELTSKGARVRAQVNPNKQASSYWFEYGPTPALGSEAPLVPASAGSALAPTEVSEKLTGLAPNTTYYYRVVVNNKEGYAVGSTATFTTLAPSWYLLSTFGASGTGPGQFKVPVAAAADASGNVWVADKNNSRLQKFSTSGEFLAQFGVKGAGAGEVNEPSAVAVDAQGDVWVGEAGNDRVQEFSPSGTFLRQIGANEGTNRPKDPVGIAVGGDGNVYVSDREAGAVLKFSPTPNAAGKHFLQRWNNPYLPRQLGTASNGQVWLVTRERRIYQVDPTAGPVLKFTVPEEQKPGKLWTPEGIEIDALGNVLISDSGTDWISQFSPTGQFQALFGSSGTGPNQFKAPKGLAMTPGGVLFVTDESLHRVSRWSE